MQETAGKEFGGSHNPGSDVWMRAMAAMIFVVPSPWAPWPPERGI